MTTTTMTREVPSVTGRRPVRLAAAAPGLWRVVDARGFVIGHVEARPEPQGTRFCARRFHSESGRFRDLGDFWSVDDAIDCLRWLT